jgi:DtxR family Mn-dependent transcriptional regulator
LCYLGTLGLYPGKQVQVLSRAPFGGPLHILVGETATGVEHMLGVELAEHIIVTVPPVDELTK